MIFISKTHLVIDINLTKPFIYIFPCVIQSLLHPNPKQRHLPPPRPPKICRPHQLLTPLDNPPPFPHKPLSNLPIPRDRRLPPNNQPARPRGSPIPKPHNIRTHILLIPLIQHTQQIIPHNRRREKINPRVMRTTPLQIRRPQTNR